MIISSHRANCPPTRSTRLSGFEATGVATSNWGAHKVGIGGRAEGWRRVYTQTRLGPPWGRNDYKLERNQSVWEAFRHRE